MIRLNNDKSESGLIYICIYILYLFVQCAYIHNTHIYLYTYMHEFQCSSVCFWGLTGTESSEFTQDIPPRLPGTAHHRPPALPPHLLQVVLNKDSPPLVCLVKKWHSFRIWCATHYILMCHIQIMHLKMLWKADVIVSRTLPTFPRIAIVNLCCLWIDAEFDSYSEIWQYGILLIMNDN